MILEQSKITKINNYLFAIRVMVENCSNEYKDSIIQLINDIEKLTFTEEDE